MKLIERANAGPQFVSLDDVASVGMTARQWQLRVRAGVWVPIATGCWRHVATAPNFELTARATARALDRDAALSGAAAAAWWGLDGFSTDEVAVHFTVPRARRWHTSAMVSTTRDWRRGDVVWHAGLRVTTATRTVLDLATFGEPARRIEGAIDSGIRLRLTSIPTLRRRVDDAGGHGRRGAPLLRELMLDSGGESMLERRFLRLMRASGLPRPKPQIVYAREGQRAMRVDFEFHNGLVVEVSGRLGHTSDRDRQKDARRRNALQQQGKRTREFTTADVMDDEPYVVATIRDALRLK